MSRVDYRNIEDDTLDNQLYRKVLYTVPQKFQLVLMTLKPGEYIPAEVHDKQVQFIRVESGEGVSIVNGKKYKLENGVSITIPPKKKHFVANVSKTKDLKLYTIYAPPEHPPTRKNKRQPK